MRDRAAATDVEPQNDSAVYDSSRGCPPAGSWPTSGWQDDVETRDMGDGAAATDVEPQNNDVLYDWSFGCPPACPSPTPSRQDDVEKPDMGDGAVATDVEPPTPSAVLAEVLARSMGGSAPSMTSLLRGLSRTGVTTDVAQALLGQRPPAEAPAEAVRAASEFAELVQTLAMTEPRARKVYKDAERARKAERKDAERAYLDAQYAADIVLLRSACVDIALRGRASARRERGPTSWDVPRFVVLDTATAEEAALIETHDAAMDRFEADYQRACAAADHRRDAALLDAIDLRDYRNIRDAEQAAADAKNTFHSKVHTGRRFLDAKELGQPRRASETRTSARTTSSCERFIELSKEQPREYPFCRRSVCVRRGPASVQFAGGGLLPVALAPRAPALPTIQHQNLHPRASMPMRVIAPSPPGGRDERGGPRSSVAWLFCPFALGRRLRRTRRAGRRAGGSGARHPHAGHRARSSSTYHPSAGCCAPIRPRALDLAGAAPYAP